MTDPLAPGDLLSVPQVLALVPIGRSTLYQLIEDGELPAYRVGATRRRRGRILVAKADLIAFLARSRQARTGAPTRVDVDGILDSIRNGRTSRRRSR